MIFWKSLTVSAAALLATAALVVMPNSPYLWIAAGMLWILDASINVSMEPFRALVGDMLPDRQRSLGYSMQSWFIGVGAVVASATVQHVGETLTVTLSAPTTATWTTTRTTAEPTPPSGAAGGDGKPGR